MCELHTQKLLFFFAFCYTARSNLELIVILMKCENLPLIWASNKSKISTKMKIISNNMKLNGCWCIYLLTITYYLM